MRELTLAVGPTRTVLLQAVRALDFTTTTEQLTIIRAERGSRLLGLSLTASRVPVALSVAVTAAGTGTSLDIRLEDRWSTTGRSAAAVAVYAEVFTDVLTRIDEHLARADPAAAAGFDGWWRVLPEEQLAARASGAAGAARLDAAVRRGSSRLLDGPRQGPVAGAAGATFDGLTIIAPDATAQVGTEVADGMLTAGQLVVSDPGGMPAALVEQVQAMVVTLEHRLADAQRTGRHGALPLEVGTADKPVVTFLFQQAALREKLPVRQLSTCTTCRLEKVINPAFLAERERNRRVRVLQTSVGAVFGSHTVSPFILFGRLAQLKKTDPDFVCARCQGTDADEKPITFCPRCGDRRTESVLRVCPHCSLDLRTLLPRREVWVAIEQPEPAPEIDPERDPEAWSPPTLSTDLPPAAVPDPAVPPGWYADPWARHEVRYWDGSRWTAYVGSAGVTGYDAPLTT